MKNIVANHFLVPKHLKLSEEEKKELLEKLNISLKELPKIYNTDAAIQDLKAEAEDIIKITRNSKTAGESVYYRVVINA